MVRNFMILATTSIALILVLASTVCTTVSSDLNLSKVSGKEIYGKKLLLKTDGNATYINGCTNYDLVSNTQYLFLKYSKPFQINIPISQKLSSDSTYQIEFEYCTDFSNEELNSIYFCWPQRIRGEITTVPYYQICTYDSSFFPVANWRSFRFTSIGNDQMRNLTIEFRRINPFKYFAIRNIRFCKDSSDAGNRNLVPNGDFEFNLSSPNGLFYGATDCINWRECMFNQVPCLETRDVMFRNNIVHLEDGEILKGYVPVLGTPDINSSNLYTINGYIQAYSGRYYARIGASKNGDPMDNHSVPGEYMEVKLKEQLIAGREYEMGIAFMHDPTSAAVSNYLGIKFTKCAFSMLDSLALKHVFPTCDILISENVIDNECEWRYKTFKYIAKGDEQYLTIGPFVYPNVIEKTELISKSKNEVSTNHAFYLIDQVSLVLRK